MSFSKVLLKIFITLMLLGLSSAIYAGSITDVKITNITGGMFTISWISDKSEPGSIRYGKTGDNLNKTAWDDRGKEFKGRNHHVSIMGLEPETRYFFDIISGDCIDDNAGKHYSVTTGKSLIPQGSDQVYGKIYGPYGEDATGAIVYIKLRDNDGVGTLGESGIISVLVGKEGYWFVDLINFRTRDGKAFFEYSSIGDSLIIHAVGKDRGLCSLVVDTGCDSPVPDLILEDSGSYENQ
jgi:hypothetical protein